MLVNRLRENFVVYDEITKLKKQYAFFMAFLNYIFVAYIGWADVFSLNLNDYGRMGNVSSALSSGIVLQVLLFLGVHFCIFFLIYYLISRISWSFMVKGREYWFFIVIPAMFWLVDYSIIGYAIREYPFLSVSMMSGGMELNGFYEKISFYTSLFLMMIFLVGSFILVKIHQEYRVFFIVFFGSLYLSTPFWSNESAANNADILNPPEKTNVIFIGMDSISKNQIEHYRSDMPHVSEFLDDSVDFTSAYTPMGRTFPAWNAILTGKYPATTGMRFNLGIFGDDKFNKHVYPDLLSVILKKEGYTTVYAQDERRFNNINEEYGFDKVVGPLEGAVDFIIPRFSDNPFATYFMDSVAGRYLFPNIYNNRVSPITYVPKKFSESVVKEVFKVRSGSDSPLFLAVHFCLAHYPYAWNKLPFELYGKGEVEMHRAAAYELDKQFDILMSGLKRAGVLENAIVVLLSDHGEGIGSPQTYVDGVDPDHPSRNFSRILRGHGNTLLVDDQIHIVLNAKKFGDDLSTPMTVNAPVSLIDLKPTVLDFLDMFDAESSDGISLKGMMYGEINDEPRMIKMETGVSVVPPKPGASEEDLKRSVEDNIKYYRMGESGRLEMKDEFAYDRVVIKQFGAISEEFMALADCSLPSPNVIYIDRSNDQYISSSDVPDDVRVNMMVELEDYINRQDDCLLNDGSK
ncbi:sulfatase-like hydrolase/transferase [Oceanobacter sp. 4_MG-2023]|uniref:sulfatase-like hydrolase/transferase n=1 Tax=Oceanobacter sp. 4_MG-2023 TaxID=3062623 RepID=UPI002734E352|nr:sulfatase-like hydrolase/transferase [Oceanobacter sp. 4_MG-2023]MDP2549061.1 sulfatase-like hydrolase/transferase [Oceanobacter sp. 4_MG-2023]